MDNAATPPPDKPVVRKTWKQGPKACKECQRLKLKVSPTCRTGSNPLRPALTDPHSARECSRVQTAFGEDASPSAQTAPWRPGAPESPIEAVARDS